MTCNRSEPRNRGSTRYLGLLAAILVVGSAHAELPLSGDWQTQVHGFAAQGYARSWDNNFIGQSTDNQGSGAYYEWGLNGSAAQGPISVSVQGLMRRVGNTDTGGPRLDFGFVDYQPVDTQEFSFGLRYGRVKNPYGLYNDTRDVVFARPGILMPNSIYLETAGGAVRNLLFASDGGQAYGGWALGDHYLSATATRAFNSDFGREDSDKLFGPGSVVKIKDLTVARIMDEWAAGTWRAALSYLSGTIDFSSVPFFGSGTFDYDSYVLSLERHFERWSLSGEYVFNRSKASIPGFKTQYGDGIYVQADYRVTPTVTAMGRYDAQFSDRSDRDGRAYAAATPGADRHSRYTHDFVVGGKWLPDAHWGFWVEQHFMLGTSSVPPAENPGGARKGDSELFLMMVGYHF